MEPVGQEGGADGGGAGKGAGADEVGDAEKVGDAERASGPDDETPEERYYCDLCGSVMLNLHCKLICETCGYKRDCSDP